MTGHSELVAVGTCRRKAPGPGVADGFERRATVDITPELSLTLLLQAEPLHLEGYGEDDVRAVGQTLAKDPGGSPPRPWRSCLARSVAATPRSSDASCSLVSPSLAS